MIGCQAIGGDDHDIADGTAFAADELVNGSEGCFFGGGDAVGIQKDFGVILARLAACFFTFYANDTAPRGGAQVFAFIINV